MFNQIPVFVRGLVKDQCMKNTRMKSPRVSAFNTEANNQLCALSITIRQGNKHQVRYPGNYPSTENNLRPDKTIQLELMWQFVQTQELEQLADSSDTMEIPESGGQT